jgi:acetyltransferase-like isoleucine patch superfamily enzyme
MVWNAFKTLSNRWRGLTQGPERLLLSNRTNLAGYKVGKWSYGSVEIAKGSVSGDLTIGNFCSFAGDTWIFLGGEHNMKHVTTFPLSYFFGGPNKFVHSMTKGNVKIGSDVWVGRGATILSGVTIGDGAVVGAHSLVARDVPPYAVVAGNPAKVLKYRFPDVIISDLLQIAWWDWSDNKIMREMPLLQSKDIETFVSRHRKAAADRG